MGIFAEDVERVKEAINLRAFCDQHLERRGSNTYTCPACGSGTHGNRTAAFTIDADKGRFKCFSCGAGGDVLDLIGILNGTEDKREQLEAAAEWAGIELQETAGRRGVERPSKGGFAPNTTIAPWESGKVPKTEQQTDFTGGRERHRRYIEDMRKNIDHPEAVAYLASRGFTLEDAEALGMGYDPAKRRIILPWEGSDYYHIDRSIDRDGDGKYDKPKAAEVGKQPLYNPRAIRDGRAFFIVEGVLDAMAVSLAPSGYQAVALGGVGTADLMDALRGTTAACCIVATDADERGEETATKIAEQLDRLGVAHIRYRYHDGAKDMGDELRDNRAMMDIWLDDAQAELYRKMDDEYDDMLDVLEVRDPGAVAGMLERGECNISEPLQTGLRPLDAALGGGLPARGLVVLGAVSSTGKTTLCVQVADYMAACGRGVLFVTIEQGAAEIVAKSLSRITSGQRRANGNRIMLSTQHITSARNRASWAEDGEKRAAFASACAWYRDRVAPHLRILESENRPDVARLESVARAMTTHDGEAPVIIVDYLQLLAPVNDRDTDKRNMDANVTALRQLARDMDTCVVVISTLNRSSYDGGISMDSYKESGSIEYGADVLLGLQPRGIYDVMNNPKKRQEQRAAEIAEIQQRYREAATKPCEVVVLKNRNGAIPNCPAMLDFDAMTSTFSPGEA